jgi:hypothetical protein
MKLSRPLFVAAASFLLGLLFLGSGVFWLFHQTERIGLTQCITFMALGSYFLASSVHLCIRK